MASKKDLHNGNTLDDENDCSCPICLRSVAEMPIKVNKKLNDSDLKVCTDNAISNVDFVYSRTCGHVFCLSCIQQISLASSYAKRTRTMQYLQEYEQVITTTQVACPMCRAELSYFDLMKVSVQNVRESDAIKDITYSTKIIKSEEPVVVSSDPIPIELLGSKFLSKDKSYVQFPLNMNDITTYGVILYSEYFKESVPTGVLELTDCTFLAFTNTFKALAKKIDTLPDTEFTVWLNFSDNFQFITHGVCRKVDRKEFYEDIAGESNAQLRTEVKTFAYPISVTDNTLMCRVHPAKIPPKVPSSTDTFWGNIFCQQLMIGLASYHFVKKPHADGSDDDGAIAYISYDHKLTSAWPPLDNGRPIPSRVFFRNISSADPNTFCGSICWYDDYQTTWNGFSRWDYEMKFDTTFVCIRSGTVKSVSLNHGNVSASDTDVVSTMSTRSTQCQLSELN